MKRYLTCPVTLFTAIIAASAFSLGAAYIAQYVYGLQPCILCLYQRVPFAAAILIGMIGLFAFYKKWPHTPFLVLLAGLAFLANAGIAAYHTGVERKWWPSHLEGCTVPDLGDDPQKIMERILAAPAVRCDEIPWADPVFGFSMANYNVLWCAALFLFCLLSFILMRKQA